MACFQITGASRELKLMFHGPATSLKSKWEPAVVMWNRYQFLVFPGKQPFSHRGYRTHLTRLSLVGSLDIAWAKHSFTVRETLFYCQRNIVLLSEKRHFSLRETTLCKKRLVRPDGLPVRSLRTESLKPSDWTRVLDEKIDESDAKKKEFENVPHILTWLLSKAGV